MLITEFAVKQHSVAQAMNSMYTFSASIVLSVYIYIYIYVMLGELSESLFCQINYTLLPKSEDTCTDW